MSFFLNFFSWYYTEIFLSESEDSCSLKVFCLLVLIKHDFIKALSILTAKEMIDYLKTATDNP